LLCLQERASCPYWVFDIPALAHQRL